MTKKLFNNKFFLSLISGTLCACFFCELYYYNTGSNLSLGQIFSSFILFHIISFGTNSVKDMKEILLPAMCSFNIIGVCILLLGLKLY